jgi:hypothetical protein
MIPKKTIGTNLKKATKLFKIARAKSQQKKTTGTNTKNRCNCRTNYIFKPRKFLGGPGKNKIK